MVINEVSQFPLKSSKTDSPAQNTHGAHVAVGLLINSLSVNDLWLRQKVETPVLHNIDLGEKRLAWQLYNGCHFMCRLINTISAMFEENCGNISNDILDFVICFPLGTTDDIISFNTKTLISPQ